jgi:ketosteroid isomerase-like protein
MEDGRADFIREAIEAFNRGDIDRMLEFCDPEVEIADPERTGTTWRGHNGYRAFIQEWIENFDEYQVEIEAIEQNGDRFFIRLTQRGRGAGSGIEFALPIHYAITVRDDKMARMEIATDPDDARRAAGLAD